MMTQEMYVNINDLAKQGWTHKEIAVETGYHPATVSSWLNGDRTPGDGRRKADRANPVMTGEWRERLEKLIEDHPRLLGVSVHERLKAQGFTGGYSTVTDTLREIRGPRFRPAERVSVPITTEMGEEGQFDFCDLDAWAVRWGWDHTTLKCFGAILSYSRHRLWWFTMAEDRQHTFEGMARFLEDINGVPGVLRTDRMGALGTSQGARFKLHAPTVAFAAHYGVKIASCKAGDAKRKGKVERPFRQLRETFLPELEIDGPPADLAELNARAAVWLAERVHSVPSRTTGVRPVAALKAEQPFLAVLPKTRFDTDYVESRRVHNVLPFIQVDAIRYSVPPAALNQIVEIRRAVDATHFDVLLGGRLIRSHEIATDRFVDVWHPEDLAAAEAIALGPSKPARHLTLVTDNTDNEELQFGDGDYAVDSPNLDDRYPIQIVPLNVDDGGEVRA